MKQAKQGIFLAGVLFFSGQTVCSATPTNLSNFFAFYNCLHYKRAILSIDAKPSGYIPCSSGSSGINLVGHQLSIGYMDSLKRFKLDGLELPNADFKTAMFNGVSLKGSKLPKANFANGYVYASDLSGSELQNADFRGTKIIGVDVRGTDLSNSVWNGALLKSMKFQGADLKGMRGLEDPKTQIKKSADFRGALNMPARQKFVAKDKGAMVDMTRSEERAYQCYQNPLYPGSY